MTYIKDIKIAISKVKEPYRIWKDYSKKDSPNEGDDFMLERVFCYEFYHQFRTLMDDSLENQSKYQNLYFHGEITKYGEYPDFVLHSGQGDNMHQAVAIEVKTKQTIERNHKKCNMKNDLIKLLNLAADKSLKYEYGVFIGVNCKNEDLKKKILRMRGKPFDSYKDLFDSLYIIGTEDNTPFTLSSLFLSRRTSNQ